MTGDDQSLYASHVKTAPRSKWAGLEANGGQ